MHTHVYIRVVTAITSDPQQSERKFKAMDAMPEKETSTFANIHALQKLGPQHRYQITFCCCMTRGRKI